MPSSLSSRLGDLPSPALQQEEDTGEVERNRRKQEALRDMIRSHCRDQLAACVVNRESAMSERDAERYMQALEERNLTGPDLQTEEDKTRAVQELAGRHAQEFIRQATVAGRIAEGMIREAERKKWILESKAAEWRARMKEGRWEEKKEFIMNTDDSPEAHTLRAFKRNWREISDDYKDIRRREKELGITEKDYRQYPALAELHDREFMSGKLRYLERRWRMDRAKKFLDNFGKKAGKEAPRGKEELVERARAEVRKAIHAKAVDERKVMRWLEERILTKPPKELEKYIAVQLKGYIGSCLKTRILYDVAETEIQKNGIPQGFHRLPPEKFILLNLNQRKAYVRMAEQCLRSRQGETHPAIEDIKLGIRHALDTKDWEEAGELLKNARKLLNEKKGTERDHTDLDSMDRYLRDFRVKEQEKGSPVDVRKTLEGMRTAFAQVPASLRPLYLGAMNDGYTCATRLFQILYNRKWCTEHGYLTRHREKILEESATEETKRLAKNKHRKKGLDNVKLGAVTDPDNSPAVRRYDEGEWAPTFIHMPAGEHEQMLSILKERKDSYAFGYWTTLLPNITYGEQLHLIEDVNGVLKSGMRKLKEAGFLFSLTGPPIPLN